MTLRQAIKTASASLKRREVRKSERVLVATISDVTYLATRGVITCRLEDGNHVRVHAWTNLTLSAGQTVAIIPVSDYNWKTFFLLSVNGSTDLNDDAFVQPAVDPAILAQHSLSGDRHTGSLPWSRVSTSSTQVDLETQVTGNLPLTSIEQILPELTTVVVNQSVGAGVTVTGTTPGVKRGIPYLVTIANGATATFELHASASRLSGELLYATETGVSTPYSDPMVWYHSASTSHFYWRFTNTGASPATFVVTVKQLVIEP